MREFTQRRIVRHPQPNRQTKSLLALANDLRGEKVRQRLPEEPAQLRPLDLHAGRDRGGEVQHAIVEQGIAHVDPGKPQAWLTLRRSLSARVILRSRCIMRLIADRAVRA